MQRYINDGARYNPSTNSWTATSTINAPGSREIRGHLAYTRRTARLGL
jgi:hypothetical protein